MAALPWKLLEGTSDASGVASAPAAPLVRVLMELAEASGVLLTLHTIARAVCNETDNTCFNTEVIEERLYEHLYDTQAVCLKFRHMCSTSGMSLKKETSHRQVALVIRFFETSEWFEAH